MQCERKTYKEGGESFSPRNQPLRASAKLQSTQLTAKGSAEGVTLRNSLKSELLGQTLSKIAGFKSTKTLEVVPRNWKAMEEFGNKSNFQQLSPRSTSSHQLRNSALLLAQDGVNFLKPKLKKSPSQSKKMIRKKKSSVQQSTTSLSTALLASSQRLLGTATISSDLLSSLRGKQPKKLAQQNSTHVETGAEKLAYTPRGGNILQNGASVNGTGALTTKLNQSNREYFATIGDSQIHQGGGLQIHDEEYWQMVEESKSATRRSGESRLKKNQISKKGLSAASEALFLINSNILSPIGTRSGNTKNIEFSGKRLLTSPKGVPLDQNSASARSLLATSALGSRKVESSKANLSQLRTNSSKRNEQTDKSMPCAVLKESQLLASLSDVQLRAYMHPNSGCATGIKELKDPYKSVLGNTKLPSDAFNKKSSAKKVRKTLTLCRSGDLRSECSPRSTNKVLRHQHDTDRSPHPAQTYFKSVKRARLMSDDLNPSSREKLSPRQFQTYIDQSQTCNPAVSPRKSSLDKKEDILSSQLYPETMLADLKSLAIAPDKHSRVHRDLKAHKSGQICHIIPSKKNHKSSNSTGSLNAVDDLFKQNSQRLVGNNNKLSLLGMKVDRIVREVQKSAKVTKSKDSMSRIPEVSNLGQLASSRMVGNTSNLQKSLLKNESHLKLLQNRINKSELTLMKPDPQQPGLSSAGTQTQSAQGIQKYLQLETYGPKKKHGKKTQQGLVKELLSPRNSAPHDSQSVRKSSRRVSPKPAGAGSRQQLKEHSPRQGPKGAQLQKQYVLNNSAAVKTPRAGREAWTARPVATADPCVLDRRPVIAAHLGLCKALPKAAPNPESTRLFQQSKGIDNTLGVGYFCEQLSQEFDQAGGGEMAGHLRVFSLSKDEPVPRAGEHRSSRSDVLQLDKLSRIFRLNGPNKSQPKIRSKKASAKESNLQPRKEHEEEVTVKKKKSPLACAFIPGVSPSPFKQKKNLLLQSPKSQLLYYPIHQGASPFAPSALISTPAGAFPSGQQSPKVAKSGKHPPIESESDILLALRNTMVKGKKSSSRIAAHSQEAALTQDAIGLLAGGQDHPEDVAKDRLTTEGNGTLDDAMRCLTSLDCNKHVLTINEEEFDEDGKQGACPFAEPDYPSSRDFPPVPCFIPRLLAMGGRPLITTTSWATTGLTKMQPCLPVPKDLTGLGCSFHLAKLELIRQKRMKRSLPRRKPEVSEVLSLIANRSRENKSLQGLFVSNANADRLETTNYKQRLEVEHNEGPVSIEITERSVIAIDTLQTHESEPQMKLIKEERPKEGYLFTSTQGPVTAEQQRHFSHNSENAKPTSLRLKDLKSQEMARSSEPASSQLQQAKDPNVIEPRSDLEPSSRSRLWSSLAKLKAIGGQDGLPNSLSKPTPLGQPTPPQYQG